MCAAVEPVHVFFIDDVVDQLRNGAAAAAAAATFFYSQLCAQRTFFPPNWDRFAASDSMPASFTQESVTVREAQQVKRKRESVVFFLPRATPSMMPNRSSGVQFLSLSLLPSGHSSSDAMAAQER